MIANLYWALLNTNDMTWWRKLAAKTNLNPKHAHQKQTNKQKYKNAVPLQQKVKPFKQYKHKETMIWSFL